MIYETSEETLNLKLAALSKMVFWTRHHHNKGHKMRERKIDR